MGHGAHDMARLVQDQLHQPGVLARGFRQLSGFGAGGDHIEIDESSFRLGNDLLRDDEHVARLERQQPGGVQIVVQLLGEVGPGPNFRQIDKRMNRDHRSM